MSGSATASCSRAASCRRNGIPWPLEHARAIGSKALGQAQAILTAVHNTPFGDIVDTEDDLQPLVFSMFRDATRTVKLVAAAMATAEFDAVRLEARAGDGWTTLTELADTLVRDHGLPFRSAHAVTGRLIAARAQQPPLPLSDSARRGVERRARHAAVVSGDAARRNPEPPPFRGRPPTHGGPAPTETSRAIEESNRNLAVDEQWWASATQALVAAEARRRKSSRAVVVQAFRPARHGGPEGPHYTV